MANPIKRIEKDFFLKVLFDEKTPLVFVKNRKEHVFKLEKLPKDNQIILKTDDSVEGLKIHQKLNLIFDYQGQSMGFSVNVVGIKDDIVTGETPEFLYRDLERSFSRTQLPQDLQVQFTISGERYSLACPRIHEITESHETLLKDFNLKDLGSLIEQMRSWIKENTTSHRVVFFKDLNPVSTEECIIAKMGKTLYLPSTENNLPDVDPYPAKRIITHEMFKQYLKSTGMEDERIDSTIAAFFKAKYEKGITSEAWVPVIFHEFVIGYINVWDNFNDRKTLDYQVIDTLYQFAAILVYSLKAKGYFEKGKLGNDPFESKVIDISVSGLSFACPHSSSLAQELMPGKEISIRLTSPKRSVTVNSKIVRHYKDRNQAYFGCRFNDMEPEDTRFLFEYLYGKNFSDEDVTFVSGQV